MSRAGLEYQMPADTAVGTMLGQLTGQERGQRWETGLGWIPQGALEHVT